MTMANDEQWVIRLTGIPDGYVYPCRMVRPFVGHYLASFDPDAREGLGEAVWVDTSSEAIKFPSFEAAKARWEAQSTVMPTRYEASGEVENRPLRFCSVDISRV